MAQGRIFPFGGGLFEEGFHPVEFGFGGTTPGVDDPKARRSVSGGFFGGGEHVVGVELRGSDVCLVVFGLRTVTAVFTARADFGREDGAKLHLAPDKLDTDLIGPIEQVVKLVALNIAEQSGFIAGNGVPSEHTLAQVGDLISGLFVSVLDHIYFIPGDGVTIGLTGSPPTCSATTALENLGQVGGPGKFKLFARYVKSVDQQFFAQTVEHEKCFFV